VRAIRKTWLLSVPPLLSIQTSSLTDRLRQFALVGFELALILGVVYRFEIETRQHFLPVLCLAVGGFLVHAWLPRRLRAWFFALLSLAGIMFVLGWPSGAWVIGIGAGLIALCRLPGPPLIRALLLVLAGVQLASCRVQYPAPFWPVLGSMFMFRLIVYVYETRRERVRPSLAPTLAYFFPLPNVCFTLFPVLDYKTFRETYYDTDDYAVYQAGVARIVRGIGHLLVYRFVKYYLLPSPHELRDGAHLALFLATNYALYVRVSGWFHISTGLLHLFGFHLPRTHDNYFLASSFSDIWRRINIYWKDFMMKVFFLPAFFTLRRWGTGPALTAAVLWVFLATWLLHSYQMFWLVGSLPLRGNDAVLWLTVGVLVVVNIHLEVRRARRASLPGNDKAPETTPSAGRTGRVGEWRLREAVSLSLRTAGMFVLVSFFWACWTIPGFISYLRVFATLDGTAAAGGVVILGIILAAVAAGVLAQWARDAVVRRALLPWPVSFGQSVAFRTASLVLLLAAGTPQVARLFGPSAGELAATLRLDSYTPVEAGQIVRSYYEEIAETHVQAGALLGELTSKDEPWQGDRTQYLAITRPSDGLLERELIPGWKGTLAGSPISINRLGMRDREALTLAKPAHTCRIALVGSSVVMGYGVADDQVFKCLLEERLNAAAPLGGPRYELLNFGAGMSDVIHRRVLIDWKVFAFEPDALYYFAHQEELLVPSRHLAQLLARHDTLPYPCLEEVVHRAGIRSGTPTAVIERRLVPFGRDIVRGIYLGLADNCRQRGILPVWVYFPIPGIVEVSTKSADLVDVAAEAGFVVVNLADWSNGYTPAELKPGERDYHLSALGHQVFAERLFTAIQDRPELLPASARLKRR
jgi:hypothetical protein